MRTRKELLRSWLLGKNISRMAVATALRWYEEESKTRGKEIDDAEVYTKAQSIEIDEVERYSTPAVPTPIHVRYELSWKVFIICLLSSFFGAFFVLTTLPWSYRGYLWLVSVMMP